MTFEELQRLAQKALEEADAQESLDAVESFSLAFADWLNVQQDRQSRGESISITEEEGRTLYALHEEVMQRAETLQQDTRKDMRSLRSKAKGILAYTGKLPDSISIAKKTKG